MIRVYLPQLKLISQQQSVSARLRRGSTVERAKNAIRMQWMSNEVRHQEMRDSFVTLDSDSEGEEDTPKKPAGGDWDDNSDDGHDDGWDDWDEEGSAETSNDLISAELGTFVVSLEASQALGPEGLQGFDHIADNDFEILNWALVAFR